MKVIDIDNWERKTQFLNFSKYTNPVFSVGTRLDVTNLVMFCKKNNYSFFSTLLFVVSKCSNQIKEMKTRMENGKVIQYETIHPSYVVLQDDNRIATHLTEFNDDFNSFHAKTKEDIKRTKKDRSIREFNSHIRTDCLYVSSLQWIDFTTVSDPYDLKNEGQTSIPRITWGKYIKNIEGTYKLAFHISAHHALMDGWHIAQLFNKVENALKDIESFLEVK